MSGAHHHHGHGHHHDHHPANFGRAFAVGIALNLIFVAVEVVYGLKANSTALLSDAGHNLSDVLGLAIAALIFWQTYGLLSRSVAMSLGAVPEGIDYDAVADALAAQPGVARVHDLHIWPSTTAETVLTAHLVMPDGPPGDGFLSALGEMLHDRFDIDHMTVQIEQGNADCHGCEAAE